MFEVNLRDTDSPSSADVFGSGSGCLSKTIGIAFQCQEAFETSSSCSLFLHILLAGAYVHSYIHVNALVLFTSSCFFPWQVRL